MAKRASSKKTTHNKPPKPVTAETPEEKTKDQTPKPAGIFETLTIYRDKLDVLSKIAQFSFFLLAAGYISGFIVITIHFAKMGLPQPLIANKYLTAGFFPLLTLALVTFATRFTVKSYKSSPPFGKITLTIWAISFFVGAYYYLVYNLGGSLNVVKLGKALELPYLNWITVIVVIGFILSSLSFLFEKYYPPWLSKALLVVVSIFGFLFSILVAYTYAKGAFLWSILWLFFTFMLNRLIFNKPLFDEPHSPILSMIWFLFWMAEYTLLVYPQIPPLFGGGQTSNVIIWTQNHPLHPKNQLYSDSLEAELIYNTENSLFLNIKDESNNSHIVELNKSQIQSIVYITPNELKTRQAKDDSLAKVKQSKPKESFRPPAPPPQSPSTEGGGK